MIVEGMWCNVVPGNIRLGNIWEGPIAVNTRSKIAARLAALAPGILGGAVVEDDVVVVNAPPANIVPIDDAGYDDGGNDHFDDNVYPEVNNEVVNHVQPQVPVNPVHGGRRVSLWTIAGAVAVFAIGALSRAYMGHQSTTVVPVMNSAPVSPASDIPFDFDAALKSLNEDPPYDFEGALKGLENPEFDFGAALESLNGLNLPESDDSVYKRLHQK